MIGTLWYKRSKSLLIWTFFFLSTGFISPVGGRQFPGIGHYIFRVANYKSRVSRYTFRVGQYNFMSLIISSGLAVITSRSLIITSRFLIISCGLLIILAGLFNIYCGSLFINAVLFILSNRSCVIAFGCLVLYRWLRHITTNLGILFCKRER